MVVCCLLIVTVTFFLTMVSEIQDPTIILSDIFNIVPSVQAQKLIDTVMVFSTYLKFKLKSLMSQWQF